MKHYFIYQAKVGCAAKTYLELEPYEVSIFTYANEDEAVKAYDYIRTKRPNQSVWLMEFRANESTKNWQTFAVIKKFIYDLADDKTIHYNKEKAYV